MSWPDAHSPHTPITVHTPVAAPTPITVPATLTAPTAPTVPAAPGNGAHPAAPPSQRVVLLTQHGKEDQIAPVFQQALGWCVQRVSGFDTDLLGTFTRDTERPGSQMDAARLKARKGMELAGCPRGLASEGAFMEDPVGGFFPWNVELLLYIDDELGVEISGVAQGPARNIHAWTHNWAELTQAAADAHFPTHHLVLRPDNENDPRVVKGLADWTTLRVAFAHAQSLSAQGVVFVESDLRAFGNPTRQHLIRAAAENLVAKLQSRCPACERPGYAPVTPLRGLPCKQCGKPTRGLIGERWGCVACAHQHEVMRKKGGWADPSTCDHCNP